MQHLRYIIFIAFLLSTANVFSGNTIDSLNIALSKSKTPSEKLAVLNRLFEATLPIDDASAMRYADRALTISEFTEDEMEKGIALYNKGLYLLNSGKSNDARTIIAKTKKLASQIVLTTEDKEFNGKNDAIARIIELDSSDDEFSKDSNEWRSI